MKKYAKRNARAMAMPEGILLAIGAAMCITLGAGAVMAVLISKEYMTFSNIGYWCMAVQYFSALAGCMIGTSAIKHKPWQVIGFVSSGYYLCLLGLGLLLGGGVSAWLITGVMIGLGGASCKIPSLFPAGSGARRRRKVYFR